MDRITIRPATAADATAVVELIRALADFEHLPGPDEEAGRRLANDLGDDDRLFQVLVAEGPAGLVGYALYFLTYSTFRARPKLYLEDLFIRPEHRSARIGQALVTACARAAVRRGCCQMEWAVLHWNDHAKRFYRRLGAELDLSWQPVGLDEGTLTALAAGAGPGGIILHDEPA